MSCNFVNFCYLWTSKKKIDSTVLFCADGLEIIQLRKSSYGGLFLSEIIIMVNFEMAKQKFHLALYNFLKYLYFFLKKS